MNAVANEVTAKPAKEKAAIETVRMADGRSVEFAGKRKLLKEIILNGSDVSVRFDFRNGETRTLQLDTETQADYSGQQVPLILLFAGHGASQKVGDETAGDDDIEDMVEHVDDILGRLSKGEWNVRREGGGFAGQSILLRALVNLSGKSVDEIRAKLNGMSQAEKMAIRQSPRVKPEIERLEAEKVQKAAKVDTDALLAGVL